MEHKVERNISVNVIQRDKLAILDFQMQAYFVWLCFTGIAFFTNPFTSENITTHFIEIPTLLQWSGTERAMYWKSGSINFLFVPIKPVVKIFIAQLKCCSTNALVLGEAAILKQSKREKEKSRNVIP